MMKRLLAILTALLLCIALLPTQALAREIIKENIILDATPPPEK